METFDPYRPPRAPDDPAQAATDGGGGPPVPWDPGDVLQQAWSVVKVYWPVLVFAPIVAGICAGGPSMILNQIHPDGAALQVGVSVGGMAIQWVLGAFFGAGMAKLFLAAARRREPIFGAIFEGGPWFGKMLGANFLLGVVGVLLVFFSGAPAGAILARDLGTDAFTSSDLLLRRLDHISAEFWLALLAGSVVLLVLSAFVTLRLKFAELYVVDAGHGAIEALGASWRATQGQVLKLLGYSILVFLLSCVGMLACCVGLFAVAAVSRVADALIYLHISGRLADPAPPG